VSVPDPPLTDALRDHYLLEHELGRGGMATVYLAHDLKHDRPVALKALHAELGAAMGSERFLREIRTTARLQHPHILPIFDSGAVGGRLWFTMPYVEGESLRSRLRREVQLPVEEAVRIARETALALDHAHRHGVVHRDIKPENILLSDGQALVADFGVAHALEQGADSRLTEAGLAIGTPMYMSPEQASGGQVDARADIYALGLVLYEMLTGEPPFTGATPQAVIARRFSGEVPRARTLRPTTPARVDQVIARALAPAPADRFATAAELARALDGAAAAEGPSVTTPTGAPVIGRSSRRPSRALILGLVTLLMAGAAGALLLRPQRAAAIDADLLAVAPFDVLDPELPLWREGMVDLLARTFDGAGSLRTVPPTAAVRAWRGRADPESAGELARHFGARLAVFGTVVPAAGDSVRVRAAMLDVAQGRIVAEVEVPGSVEDMAGVADSAALGLLRGLGTDRPVGAVRSASLGTRSVPALKAFLQGEQLYRRGDWLPAIEAYRRATELDTGFALAYFHRGGAEGWYGGAADTASNRLYLRAAALNRGLSPRESLLVAAASLSAEVALASDDPGNWRRLRRQRDLLETATRQYPADPEVWYMLADARYHYNFGPGLGTRMADVASALDRALAADSAFAPAYFHRIELALGLQDAAPARRLIGRYLGLRPSAYDAQALRFVEAMLDSTVPLGAAGRMLDTMPSEALSSAFDLTQSWPDTAVLMIARAMARRPPGETRRFDYLGRLPPQVLVMRGRVREALRTGQVSKADLAFAGELGILPEDSVRAALKSSTDPPLSYATWLAVQRDTAALESLVRVADSVVRASGRFPTRSAVVNPHINRTLLALARGDTAGALTAISAVPDTLLVGFLPRILKAQLLAARGRDREAAAVLDGAPCCARITPMRVLIELERGRVAERLRDAPRAIEGYQYVVDMWRHADPELQPFVEEARQALARLSAEPRGGGT
jgi:tetratricopeptide (TPR) repeat protein